MKQVDEVATAELLKDYKDVVTSKELAEILRINVKQVYKLLQNNAIPYFNVSIGKHIYHRILKENVIKFINNEQ